MKNHKISIISIIFLFVFSFTAFAQEYEYGSLSELKNLKKVFIDTQTDLKNRERIVEEINKANIGLEIVERDDAEIVISFGGGKAHIITGATTSPVYGTDSTETTLDGRKVSIGKGFVFIKGKSKDVPRIIMDFESAQDKLGEKKPATKFAKEFIKAYKKANGLKEK